MLADDGSNLLHGIVEACANAVDVDVEGSGFVAEYGSHVGVIVPEVILNLQPSLSPEFISCDDY